MSTNLPIQQFMTRLPVELSAEDSIDKARLIMREKGIRHLPVVKGTKVLGLVSDRDIKFALSVANESQDWTVAELMSTDLFEAHPLDPVGKVAHEMAKRKIGSAIVKDGDIMVGLFTTTDALEALAYIQGFRPAENDITS